MGKAALKALELRLADAERLLEIHAVASGTGSGRRYNMDVLNRSSLLLCAAAWEGFIEDELRHAVRILATELASAADLPPGVRDSLLDSLHATKNWAVNDRHTKEEIWALAGSGWRSVYTDFAAAKIQAFHTPNITNVRKLFKDTVGLRNIANRWGTPRWGTPIYVSKLEAMLNLRHRIAHGNMDDETVGKTKARHSAELVRNLACWSDAALTSHLKGISKLEVPLKSAKVRNALLRMSRRAF